VAVNVSARSAAAWPARFLTPGAILCFHGATSDEYPSNSVVNLPATQVMSLIDSACSIATVVPLADLLDRQRSGRSLRGLVAITFDDAYASLNTLLVEYFSQRRVPATIFAATSYSGSGEPFWWDRIDDLYPHVPTERWLEFETAVGLPQEYRSGQPAEFGPLRPLRQWVLRGHLGRTSPQIGRELSRLEREMNRTTTQRPMTMDELESFCRRTGATVAPHTETHPVLPLLQPDEIVREIARSYDTLVERFGDAVVPALAAPFGLYDEKVIASANQAGLWTLSLTNRTLAGCAAATGIPRLSMTTGTTRFRLLAHASGAREKVAQWRGAIRAGFPALPGPTT
jgi:peptidoglycan/xylan/chitin deacetylase (PgdA/CDA1 family)